MEYTLDVMLPHSNRWCWERGYNWWEEKKMCWGKVQVCSYLDQLPEATVQNSCWSVTSQVGGKMPKISTFSGDPSQKGEVLFKEWVFEVKCVMQSHTEVTLWERMVWSLCEVMANLVWYLGLQAQVSEIINKLELVYGTMESFGILMQNVYNLQQGIKQKKWHCT